MTEVESILIPEIRTILMYLADGDRDQDFKYFPNDRASKLIIIDPFSLDHIDVWDSGHVQITDIWAFRDEMHGTSSQ